jgi:hypothetical protein
LTGVIAEDLLERVHCCAAAATAVTVQQVPPSLNAHRKLLHKHKEGKSKKSCFRYWQALREHAL